MKHLLRKLALRLRAGFGKRRAAPHHRRIRVEPLEERSLLAQLVNVGTATDVVYNLPASANVVFLEDDGIAANGVSQIRSSNGAFDTTTFDNPSGSLTINRGNDAAAITVDAVPDFTAGLTIGSIGSEFSTVTFAGSLMLGLNKPLVANATGTISLPNAASDLAVSGAGTVALTTTKNIALASGSSIVSVDGAITLSANQQSEPTSGAFAGVSISGATVQATRAGRVTVLGRGGDSGGPQIGVRVNGGGKIQSLSGALLVQGTGGNAAGDSHYGVWISGAGSTIAAQAGVKIAGQGGGLGNSGFGYGVMLQDGGTVSTGGSGKLTVEGTGGSGSGSANHGVKLTNTGSSILANGSDVQITGKAGGVDASGTSVGVFVQLGASVSATGSGNVTVQGTGGTGTGNGNYGVWFFDASSSIATAGGNLLVTGIEGAGNMGTAIVDAGTISTTTGSLTLVGNSASFESTANISAGTTGTVTVRPYTNGVIINLGQNTDPTGGPLGLTSAELARFTAGTISVGDTTSGAITISSDITRSNSTNIKLAPGSTAKVDVSKAGTDFDLGPEGTVSFFSGADLSIAINGAAVDTHYSQLNVVGKVDLRGVDLVLSGSYAAVAGDIFTIVNNDGADALTGTFNGLPEGKVFSVPSAAQLGMLQISYRGGDGNDVVLTAVSAADPVLSGTAGDDVWLVKKRINTLDISCNGIVVWSPSYASLTSLSILGLAGNDTLTLDMSAGSVIPSSGLAFDGGASTAAGDKLQISGGPQGTFTTYNYTDNQTGSVDIFFNKVSYAGLEQLTNSGVPTFATLNLPQAGPNELVFGDDGVVGNSLSKITGATITPTTFGSPLHSLKINRGNATDTIAVNALPDFSAGLTIGTAATPVRTIDFSGVITLAVDNNLIAFATETITSGAAIATSGLGGVFLTTARNIRMSSGSSITTADGKLSLSANQQATPSGGSFTGIEIDGAAISTTTGDVMIAGRGEHADGETDASFGVFVHHGTISGGSSGTTSVMGTGGINGRNDGVFIGHGNSAITSNGANVVVVGQSRGSGASGSGVGVVIGDFARISAGGKGTVTVQGTGGFVTAGTGPGTEGLGVWMHGTDAVITSAGGNVEVTGQGSSEVGTGVVIGDTGAGTGQISAGGAGTVTVRGTGSSQGPGYGVAISNLGSVVTSSGGNVQVIGQGGVSGTGVSLFRGKISAGGNGTVSVHGMGDPSDSVSNGVMLQSAIITSSGGNVEVTGAADAGGALLVITSTISTAENGGDLTLIGDGMAFLSATIGTAGTGKTTIRPRSSGRTINLGSDVDGTLGLTDAELDCFQTGNVIIGDNSSGAIVVSSDISRAAATNIYLNSSQSISFTNGLINTAGGDLSLTPGSTGNVGVSKKAADVSLGATGRLSFVEGSDLVIAINGPVVDTGYQQLSVVGKVDLTGVDLKLSGVYSSVVDDKFIVVNNDGDDAVIGEFNSLLEGTVFSVDSGALAGNYRITYFGGDGNDVVVTAVNVPPSFDHVSGNYSATDENPVTRGPAREQRILGWATQMSAGPGNESGQQLSFEVITDKPGLFATGGQPTVGVDGTLTFTPKPNARGIANVMVVLHDNGGGTNASEPVTFQVEITKPRRWHNSAEAGQRNGLDVTGSMTSQPDGSITAGDALAVINYINAIGSGPIGEEAAFGPPYYDVNGDDQVGPDDVLKIINYINAGNESEGEAGGGNLAETDAAALNWILYGADEYFRELGGKRRG